MSLEEYNPEKHEGKDIYEVRPFQKGKQVGTVVEKVTDKKKLELAKKYPRGFFVDIGEKKEEW